MKEETVTIRSTVQGPVFVKANDGTMALRVVGLDRRGMLQEYLDIGKAANFDELQAALKRPEVPTFDIVYGDRHGHTHLWVRSTSPYRSASRLRSTCSPD